MSDHPAHAHADGEVHAHIATERFYVGILAALVVLTVITVKVSYYDFGSLNIIIALLVATMKASLVAAFFMHLRHDKLFNTIAFLAAFLFLAIFIMLTYDDLGRRDNPDTYIRKMDPQTGQPAPGGLPATSATQNSLEHGAPGAHGGEHGGGEKKE